MIKLSLDYEDITLTTNLYWNQRVNLLVDSEQTDDIVIQREIRQGCILSPLLFNLYSE